MATLWFDKDGVLAQYDYSIYTGDPALWLMHGSHVYRDVEPYNNMCQAFRRLSEGYDTKVLTAVSNSSTLAEHVIDGMAWCSAKLNLQQKDFFACAVEKPQIPIIVQQAIHHTDILFDDYMPNLRAWKAAGGTSVKVLNKINSESEEFPCIENFADVTTILKNIHFIIKRVNEDQALPCGLLRRETT